MLQIQDLRVELDGQVLLKQIDIEIEPGETHVLFGPNGSGKTSLLMTIMGYPNYKAVRGQILFKGVDITHMSINERAEMGIGMAYQRPPTIKGLKTRQLLKLSSRNGQDVEALAQQVDVERFLDRDVNAGLSGGEIKRSELAQLLVQNPDLMLFDEPESGVDLENITLVGNTIARLLQKDTRPPADKRMKDIREARVKMGLIITHTGFILDYVNADQGHVLYDGSLTCSDNPREILSCIDQFGYEECMRCNL